VRSSGGPACECSSHVSVFTRAVISNRSLPLLPLADMDERKLDL